MNLRFIDDPDGGELHTYAHSFNEQDVNEHARITPYQKLIVDGVRR